MKNLSIGSGPLGGLSTSGDAKFNVGFAVVTSVGYGFGNGLRVEAQGDFFTNKSNGFTGGTRGVVAGGGTEQKYGLMVNALYDFVGFTTVVQPYVGAGVGVQWVNWRRLQRLQSWYTHVRSNHN